MPFFGKSKERAFVHSCDFRLESSPVQRNSDRGHRLTVPSRYQKHPGCQLSSSFCGMVESQSFAGLTCGPLIDDEWTFERAWGPPQPARYPAWRTPLRVCALSPPVTPWSSSGCGSAFCTDAELVRSIYNSTAVCTHAFQASRPRHVTVALRNRDDEKTSPTMRKPHGTRRIHVSPASLTGPVTECQ
eukprot:3216793-Rhodomonas_salina.2